MDPLNSFTLKDQQSEYYPHFQAYYACLSQDPNYSLSTYCEQHGLHKHKFGDWLRSRNIFVTDIKQKLLMERLQPEQKEMSLPSEHTSFIQLKPNDGPDGDYNPELYQGIRITFVNGLCLDMRQCTLEQLLTILNEYRPKRLKHHVRTGL
jgi:hypothetical protein